jgi:hypothetical protein
MNSRTARRLATIRLAAAARTYADQADEFTPVDGVTHADRIRIVAAFNALAHELEVRAGVMPHTPKPVPLDPDQHLLFDTNREIT